ncbi:hypothetical protein [Burkholderia thailandensis]|uniref:hypothetical protein n=1 Tax=Burkholderia thailandensis TaxID=57975 RepID=UPI0005B70833|nr:hypothetical protein [Burkholderia thailandensis]KIS56543.1 hypothetical protein BTP_2374 [Burkholderia thailandensis Phuket 4W-1]
METLLTAIALAAIAFFGLGWDRRLMDRRAKRKFSKAEEASIADPKVVNCLVEQQARIDLCMATIRLLLKTHPQKGDVTVLLRAAMTHLSEASARETPNTHQIYERTLRNALKALIGNE